MSVLFRLDSSIGKPCNTFIRENRLNQPISDNIKFYFISSKIPKTLLERNQKFDMVAYFGCGSAHYTLRNFVKSHHNSIIMYIKEPVWQPVD